MEARLRNIWLRIHLVALTTAVLNALIKSLTTYSLEGMVEFGLETFTAISGLILFFFYLKPFKKITLYFSIYAVVTCFLLVGLIFRGIFWGLVLSILLFPLIPDTKKFEENGILLSTPYQGFAAACCSYQIKERRWLMFEKDHGLLEVGGEGPIDFETVRIKVTEIDIEITYSTDVGKPLRTKMKK